MKIVLKIKGMHCNSCAMLIEEKLKDKVNKIFVSYSKEQAEIDFDENKISEKEIGEIIKKCGYEVDNKNKNYRDSGNNIGWIIAIASIALLLFVVYYFLLPNFTLPDIPVPNVGDNAGLILLFAAGLLTGFHCVSMCGSFVFSYTAKNAMNGHKSFTQHLVYGGSKVVSYAIIGGIFGLIGGIFAFSIGLRGWISILAGIFMVFYALSMFGIGFFKKFQINPKFLTNAAVKTSQNTKGPYLSPMVTGLLNGLFIACGPLQAMYLYAAGTGSFISGATSLAVFGLGTLPVMLAFGSLTTIISHKTTKKILKISAIIVLILGLIMLNRGLTLTGSAYSYDSIKTKITSGNNVDISNNNVVITNGIQEVNMDVDASGYSPNSFVLKKGISVKWNVNVKQLTGCNSELVSNEYNIDARLKQGINTFEFTPTRTGTFPFNCGMGMLRGSFIVTETGTASQEQIKSATPSKGSSCGGSGGGCGCGG